VGSACFFIGPFPGFVQLVGAGADGAVFFAGSPFFTLAALLEVRESTLRLRRWAADASWWSAAVQFAGTQLFNVSTFRANAKRALHPPGEPADLGAQPAGSVAFLISSALAYRVADRARRSPARRTREWNMAAVNLAGSIFFGVSAIASYVVPSTGSTRDLAAANFTTALGALCFFIGALMLLPRRQHADAPRPTSRPLGSNEV
jgi:hypothetical protein